MLKTYLERRRAKSTFTPVRGLRYHAHCWGDATLVTPERPPMVMVHGWMDVGASFQFVVDALAEAEGFDRWIIAPDWRGFGHTEAPGADTYWLPDYLGDLDGMLDALIPEGQLDLLGHSMGGNVVMTYGGLRPQRIRRLVNLEGFGMPQTQPHQAPKRLLNWLDELKAPAVLRDYDSVQAVAQRLMKNNHCWRPTRPRGWHRTGRAKCPMAAGTYRATRRTNAATRRCTRWLRCWKRGSSSPRRCCGSRAT